MIRSFVLYRGKHEDQSWACIILTHEEGFKTALHGLLSLRGLLLAHAKAGKACCQSMPEDANFCPKCGRAREDIEADEWELQDRTADLFLDLFDKVYNGTHDFWTLLDEAGWEHGKLVAPEQTCTAVNVDRWMAEPDEHMEIMFHDGSRWTTFG